MQFRKGFAAEVAIVLPLLIVVGACAKKPDVELKLEVLDFSTSRTNGESSASETRAFVQHRVKNLGSDAFFIDKDIGQINGTNHERYLVVFDGILMNASDPHEVPIFRMEDRLKNVLFEANKLDPGASATSAGLAVESMPGIEHDEIHQTASDHGTIGPDSIVGFHTLRLRGRIVYNHESNCQVLATVVRDFFIPEDMGPDEYNFDPELIHEESTQTFSDGITIDGPCNQHMPMP